VSAVCAISTEQGASCSIAVATLPSPARALRVAADCYERRSLGDQLVQEPADRRTLAQVKLRVVHGLDLCLRPI
jgi:hypothetical protein